MKVCLHECTEVFHHRYHFCQIYQIQKSHERETFSIRKDGFSFVSEIITTWILLFIILTNESNLFLIEVMFNWAHINLFTFLSLNLLRVSFGSPVLTDSVDPLIRVSQLWLLLSKSRDINLFKLVFRCWCQFSFTKNLEKFSAKILILILLKCSLLSFSCLLGSILFSCKSLVLDGNSLPLPCCSNRQNLVQCQIQLQCYHHFSMILLDLL